jgi:hypothetical protein
MQSFSSVTFYKYAAMRSPGKQVMGESAEMDDTVDPERVQLLVVGTLSKISP